MFKTFNNDPHWTMIYRPRLILSVCYSPYFSQWLGVRLQNPRFWAYLMAKVLSKWVKLLEPSGHRTVINCAITFRATNIFSCFYGAMAQFEHVKNKFSNQTTLRIHLYGLQIIHGLNCFCPLIYESQINTYQNIAKPLTYNNKKWW